MCNNRGMNPILILRYILAAFLISITPLAAQSAANPAHTADPAELVKQGQKLNSEGKQDEALALYRQALEAAPNLYEAHLASGIALDLKGQYEEARHHLAKAIELAPPDKKDQALRTMAMSYAFEGDANGAAKYEQQLFDEQMSKQDFNNASEIANELARVYLESGDPDNAYKWYKTGYETALRKADMKDADKNLWLFRWEHAQARIAARRGQGDEAQKHVSAAKAALDKANNPDQARFLPYLTGYVALYTGDYKTAIADLQKADQHDPFILSLLAQAYEKSGDRTQAMEYYRKVLASNAHNPTNAFARPLAKKKVAAGSA
jgi:tetratricopeptide (TPR) repeat protein